MAQVLSTTLPIFILIALGFSAVRTGVVSKDLVAGIGRFVLFFAMPSLIFKTISRSRFGEIIDTGFLLAYGIGSFASLLLMMAVFRFGFKNDVTFSGLKGLGSSLPNSIYIGYPVLVQLFDRLPTGAFAMALLVENLLILPIALIVMEVGFGKKNQNRNLTVSGNFFVPLKEIALRLLTNPLLLAIFSGFAFASTSFALPSVAEKVVSMLAQAAPAAALFFIGGLLVGTKVSGSGCSIGAVVIGKLIVHPLLVALMVFVLPAFSPDLQKAAIILAASPMFAIFPIIASKYGHGENAATMLLFTTIVSFVTITVILVMVMG